MTASNMFEEDFLDIGKQLKQENIQQKNKEKLEKIKQEYNEESKKEKSKKKETKNNFLEKYRVVILILIICLVASGLRFYIASMPITETWAESVVEQNLENQVVKKISDQYPTFSESKKDELVLQGTREALAASQNQVTINELSKKYKESYKDPLGATYLYEIDPYFFYRIATQGKDPLSKGKEGHTLLAFIELWWYQATNLFFNDVSFTGAIFYLPLLFTLLSAIIIFFLGKELWNDNAGFISALFFVIHPIMLEFSLLGFVDTNMVNLFTIVTTGLLFLLIIRCLRTEMKYKYLIIIFLSLAEAILILAFVYLWSAWYISVILPLVALCCYSILVFRKKISILLENNQKRKYVFFASIALVVLIFGVGYYGTHAKDQIVNKIGQIIPENLAKYLHVGTFTKNQVWPDAFFLIKELQTADVIIFINYMGGKAVLLVVLGMLLYVGYSVFKKPDVKYVYLLISFMVFGILSFRAIRIFPYFVPYLSLLFGIGIALISEKILEKIGAHITNEKKGFEMLLIILVLVCIGFPFVYSLSSGIRQTTNIMPIMDDAIYNSAIYIKETSTTDAIVSTWWDRGTFYNALAERDVHLQSQPYMPTTYWLSSFYTEDDALIAANMISLLNCKGDSEIYSILQHTNTSAESVEIMHTLLSKKNKNEQTEYINSSIYVEENDKLTVESDTPSYATYILNTIFCAKSKTETYVVVIDDLMPRFSAVEYFAAWNFETQQPDPKFPYTDIEENGCLGSQSGVYCSIQNKNVFVNFTSLLVSGQVPANDVYVVENGTVQYMHQNITSSGQSWTLITYQRAGYWKAVYLPKQVADSMYVRLMLLDGYNAPDFEKVFDEVHIETSWVKVYKMKWNVS